MKRLDETLDIREIDLHRRDDCKFYDKCLNEASTKRWRSFSCLDCREFEKKAEESPQFRKASNLVW